MTEFVTVYPPPPPTWNHLSSAQRSSLRRSTKKVAKVLGTGMATTVGGDVPPPATKSTKRRLFRRLFASTSSPSHNCEPPLLRFSDRPPTPTFTESFPTTTIRDEGANKRAKLARVQRLLGDEVPVEMVFPTAPTPPSRPNTPLPTVHGPFGRRPHDSSPSDFEPHHTPKMTVIRIHVPTLTREEKRSLGLDIERLQPVQEEDEPSSSSSASRSFDQPMDDVKYGAFGEEQDSSITLYPVFVTPDLEDDLDSQWTMGSYRLSSATLNPLSIPFCESPLSSSFISIHEDDADEFETPVSTWFDGDGVLSSLSRSLSFASSHYSFHAERLSTESEQSIEYERPLRTPPPLHIYPTSIVSIRGSNDDVEPMSELTDALFASPVGKRWSATSAAAVV